MPVRGGCTRGPPTVSRDSLSCCLMTLCFCSDVGSCTYNIPVHSITRDFFILIHVQYATCLFHVCVCVCVCQV